MPKITWLVFIFLPVIIFDLSTTPTANPAKSKLPLV